MDSDFLIVGLGASAGGVDALRHFFAAVPQDSGIAYVVILHLSPDHESHLAEILQASAPVPVTQVREHVRVEPNHVYVIPPSQSLAMNDGHLSLSDMTHTGERRAPIDFFFRTLAVSHGPRAVCVVLSGTGADGSMGMKRVKEEGGICFVQDPEEAEYADMPRSSLATALVDHVLPVREMPAKILAYKNSRGALNLPEDAHDPPAFEEQALREVFSVLRMRTGHDFSNYKRATVLRRVGRRMSVHGLSNVSGYARYIRDYPDESSALLKDLLISVTNFFRDPDTFEALERLVVPTLFEGKTDQDQIRVWVPGCATGEEAYSVAMLLAERVSAGGGGPSIHVFATDIDDIAVAAAREGVYTSNAAADLPAERLTRFFNKEREGYRVRKELREIVLFARHNVIKDPPFSHLDLVSCRNLLIYLNRAAQRRMMETLHFALRPNRFLFLGASESVEGSTDLFSTFDKDARLFQSRPVTVRISPPAVHQLTIEIDGVRAPDERPKPVRSHDRLSAAELHRALLEQYGPPSLVVNEEHEILHLSDRAGRYLQHAGGDPSHNLFKVLRPELRVELRTALYQAAQQKTSVEARGVPLRLDDRPVVVTVTVRPVLREDQPGGYFLVIFEERADGSAGTASSQPLVKTGNPAQHLESELDRLKGQLRATTERYETQAEELKASNEELQAMNEELRSSAEELETSKEELQSVNEELRTVNQELKIKIDEQTQSNNDIQNLIASAEIGTIFLDRDSRVKLFTPRARDVFNLIPSDVGRPLADINGMLVDGDLGADVARVLDRLERVEREIETRDGHWHLLRATPYRTSEDKIEGVVLTFVDITSRKRSEDELVSVKDALATELKAMTLLHDLSTRLIEAGELEPLLEEALTAALQIQDADIGAIQLRDEQTGRLRIVASRGFPPAFATDSEQQDLYSEAASAAVERRHRIVVADIRSDSGDRRNRPLAEALGYRAVQHTPLFGRVGEPLGVLSTHWRTPKAPSVSELRLLDLYARQASEVIGFTRGQEAVRKSAERLRRALEIETVGVLFFTIDGAVTYANDALWRISGHHRTVQATEPSDPMAAQGAARPQRELAGLREWITESSRVFAATPGTAGMRPTEREFSRPDGSRRWALIAAARLNDREAVQFVIDITATRQAQEQLRQSEARLRLVAESVIDYAIFTTDVNGRIDSWNPGAARMFGFTEGEAIDRPGAILFTPEDRELGVPAEEMRQARETGRASDERWHIRKDRSRFFVNGVMVPLYDTDQTLLGYAKIARDLTERKEWEEALELARANLETRVVERTGELASANQALDTELQERRQAEERIRALMGRLIGVQEDERRRIARDLHDHFGQQVAGLRLKLELLERLAPGDVERSTIVAEAQAITAKLDRDLDFFTWELRPAALDDLGLVTALGAYVREWSENFGIQAEFHTSGVDGPRLTHELETSLYRITQEALNNVYKHAHARRVGVMLEGRASQVLLVVEDDGQGFEVRGVGPPPQDRGIGLVGMRERAALVGGSLDIESSAGKGTTLFVKVPRIVGGRA